jgi:hypothetical protein
MRLTSRSKAASGCSHYVHPSFDPIETPYRPSPCREEADEAKADEKLRGTGKEVESSRSLTGALIEYKLEH